MSALPTPELMAWCIGIGMLLAVAVIALCVMFGETAQERLERIEREADDALEQELCRHQAPPHRLPPSPPPAGNRQA